MTKLLIRHPTPTEITSVGAILFDAFIDKFSHIFKGNVARGRIAFLDLYPKMLRLTDLRNILVAVQKNEVVGKLELLTQGRFTKLSEIRTIHATLARHFGTLCALKQTISILMLTGMSVGGQVAHISSIGIRPDVQDQHIGHHLLRAAELLATRRRIYTMTLNVILKNVRAQQIYHKFGYRDGRVFSLPIFHWFTGVDGFISMRKRLERP